MQPFPKQSHYVRCPALKLLCNSICGPWTKTFGDPDCSQWDQRLRWSASEDKIMQWFRIKWTIVGHNLKHAQWTKGLQKVVRSFLDADDDPDSHQNLITTFWPIYNIPW